jgi:translation initiation factor 1
MTIRKNSSNSTLVYSTESPGTSFTQKGAKKKGQAQKQPTLPKDGIVRLMRETKGRKGKGVTLIHGLDLDAAQLKKLAKSLKQRCGGGGSIKKGVIEIQGDHRDLLEAELSARGYTVKQAGG